MNELNNKILLSMECPACLEYMYAPIYVCVTGHSICDQCWKNLNICPTCRKDLSETRNYNLETLAEMLHYPCQNKEQGCNDILKLEEMDEHLRVCSFRNHKCKFPSCVWRGKKADMENHYLSCHARSVLVGPEAKCWWKNNDYDVHLMLAYGEQFYVYKIIVENCMYWVVQYIGKSEDAIQYFFQIIIYSDQYQNRKITISENCQDDMKDDIQEIIDSGYAAGVPIPALDSYKNKTGHVWYNIYIIKT